MQRILLIGGSGQVGTALRQILEKNELLAPSHHELAFEDANALNKLLESFRPTLLINCSAFHHVDTCEKQPEKAFAMNALAVDQAAYLCSKHRIEFATFSTDYVFDGNASQPYSETDSISPRTAYGASKAAGEFLTRRHSEEHYIIRTSGVFGNIGSSSKGYTLIDKVLAQAEHGEPIRIVNDMIFSPTYAPDLAQALVEILRLRAFGTHHIANTGLCSWHTFVQFSLHVAGLAHAPLQPISYSELDTPTQRPLYSPLQNTTFSKLDIELLPTWENAVERYLMQRTTSQSIKAAS